MDEELGTFGREAARKVGRTIRDAREALGISQAELANSLNKPTEEVASWEAGDVAPGGDGDLEDVTTTLKLRRRTKGDFISAVSHWHVDKLEQTTRKARAAMALLDEGNRLRVEPEGIFVVHGHDESFKEEVASFLRRTTVEPVTILHEQPNGGRTIIEKFESYSARAKFAVVLLTPDDELTDGKLRARQNVILELGYFIGRIQRSRVCALYKDPVEIPSDYAGVLYVPVDEGGSWKLDLARELDHAGIDVDLSKT